jgi:hypothetical protein
MMMTPLEMIVSQLQRYKGNIQNMPDFSSGEFPDPLERVEIKNRNGGRAFSRQTRFGSPTGWGTQSWSSIKTLTK